MSRIVGIDLGTTNSLVAMVDAGIPLVLADTEGRRLTPSVVHFPAAAGATPIVGHAANRVRVLYPATTAYSVKRFIGRRAIELSPEELGVNYPINREGKIELFGRGWTPEEVSAEV
ncbi:MAG TPA: Hsp70 family protein, partial [Verrucomicrobiae bacterium]|nr:Hsp70 family protein [Verrucomicrobiae bacterium]